MNETRNQTMEHREVSVGMPINCNMQFGGHYKDNKATRRTRRRAGGFASATTTILRMLYEGLAKVKYEKPRRKLDALIDFPITLYEHIPDEIRRTIQASNFVGPIPISGKVSPKYHYEFALPKSGRRVQISIWSPSGRAGIGAADLGRMSQWLHYLEETFPIKTSCTKTLDIYIFLTDHMKTLPKIRDQTLDEFNVNTAFTYNCAPQNQIVIFRREEWFKVFLHETMHAFGLDFSQDNTESAKTTKTLIQSCFHGVAAQDLRIYESYSEFWAEIFHILFLVHRRTELPRFNRHVAKLVQTGLQKEQIWAMQQAQKILTHYEFEFADLRTGTKTYRESNGVAIFSYYILKSVLFFHIESMMQWCRRNLPMPHVYMGSGSAAATKSFIDHLCDWSKDPLYDRGLGMVKLDGSGSLRMSKANEVSL